MALALGLGVATVAVPATPAQASHAYSTGCGPIYNSIGQLVGWVLCVEYRKWDDVDPCYCPWTFSFDPRVQPADPRFMEDVLGGLTLLEQAYENPDQAEQLWSQAQSTFLSAAERFGPGQIRLGQVGIADLERNRIEPVPVPWLVAAGTDVGNGLTLMQQALREPDPEPWLAAGMAEFEEAYQEILHQHPIGR